MNPAMAAQYYQNQQRMAPQAQHAPPQQGRRGIRGMLPGPNQPLQHTQRPQPSLSQLQEQTSERYKHDLRNVRGPQERNLPEGLDEIVIGNGVEEFKRLRAVERKLDAIMMRKRLELQDQRQKIRPRTRKLRIWITNSVENQSWQVKDLDANAFDFDSGVEPTYKVTIAGKIVDEDIEEEPAEETVESVEKDDAPKDIQPPKPRLSDLVKEIKIELDRSRALQPDGVNIIEWKKASGQQRGATAGFDCLQFERKGDENINCVISLTRDEQPPRYGMSRPLQEFMGVEEATREMIIESLWLYIRKMGLQRDEDKRAIRLDETLKTIFGSDVEILHFPRLWEHLHPQLSHPPPVKLSYTIRVDQEFQADPKPTVYDVLVAGPDPVHEQTLAILQDPAFVEDLKKIKDIDTDITALFEAISLSKNRHSFFNSMAKDPVTFLRRWVSSQKRDLEIILGDSRVGNGSEWISDEFRRGGAHSIWTTDNAKEAADLIVNRPGRYGK